MSLNKLEGVIKHFVNKYVDNLSISKKIIFV